MTECAPSPRGFWASIRERVATMSAPALVQLLLDRQGPMDEELRRGVVLPLAWVAFRFAPERSPSAQFQVPLLLTLMERGQIEVEQFIEHLEYFGGSELERLTAAPADQLELEIKEGLRDRRSGREAFLPEVIAGVAERLSIPRSDDEPAEEPPIHSAAWNEISEAIAAGEPTRDLARRCAEDPSEPTPIRARAWAEWARRTDDNTAAIDGFRRALELDVDPDVVCELADRLALRVPPPYDGPLYQHWTEEADEAVATAGRALRLGTSRPALAYRAIAFSRESQGRTDEALRAYGFAIAHAEPGGHPHPSILAVSRLRLLIRQGKLDEALPIWLNFIAQNPNSRRVSMVLLAYLQVRLGRLDEALESATDATNQVKGTRALLGRGHVRALRGEWDEAKADLDRFLTCPHSEDEYPFARAVRAWVNEALGAWEAAVLDLTHALDDDGWKLVVTQIDAYAHGLPPDRGSRAAFETWRRELLAKLLPALEHPTISRWQAQLVEGVELGSVIAELCEALVGDDRLLRQAIRGAAPAWVRALAGDASVADPLRSLRRLL